MNKINLDVMNFIKKTLTLKNVNTKNGLVNLKFASPFFRFCKTIYRTFTLKYAFNVSTPTEPCVYLCRHLNLHGALTVNKCSTFDFQTFVLHVFTNQKSCFNQFYNYTFSKRRNRSKIFAFLPSLIASLIVPPICSPKQTVPVYRNDAEAFKTIKASLDALKSGRSLLIFPDVDYTNVASSEKHVIYNGFLCLEKLYYKTTGRHLKFIPLTIDENSKTVNEKIAISFNADIPFEKEMPLVSKKIADAIF